MVLFIYSRCSASDQWSSTHFSSEPPGDPIYIDRVDNRMVVPKLLFQGKDLPKRTTSESVETDTDACETSQDVTVENYDDEEEVPLNSTRFD